MKQDPQMHTRMAIAKLEQANRQHHREISEEIRRRLSERADQKGAEIANLPYEVISTLGKNAEAIADAAVSLWLLFNIPYTVQQFTAHVANIEQVSLESAKDSLRPLGLHVLEPEQIVPLDYRTFAQSFVLRDIQNGSMRPDGSTYSKSHVERLLLMFDRLGLIIRSPRKTRGAFDIKAHHRLTDLVESAIHETPAPGPSKRSALLNGIKPVAVVGCMCLAFLTTQGHASIAPLPNYHPPAVQTAPPAAIEDTLRGHGKLLTYAPSEKPDMFSDGAQTLLLAAIGDTLRGHGALLGGGKPK